MQVLLSIGYEWLDVRPSTEVDMRGKLRDAVNVPLMIQKRRFDPETVRCESIGGILVYYIIVVESTSL